MRNDKKRSVVRCLAAVMALGCEPTGAGPQDAAPEAAPGDLGATPGDAAADAADAAGTDAFDATPDAAPDAAPDTAPDAAADASVSPDAALPEDARDVDGPADRPDAAVDVAAVEAGDDAARSDAEDAPADRAAPADAVAPVAPPQRSCAGAERPGCGSVVIDGGRFTIGTPTQCFTIPDATCGLSASPTQTELAVGRFAIDAYEVTVARFNAYWAVRGRDASAVRAAPVRYRGGAIAWEPAPHAEPARQGRDNNWLPAASSRDAHPMNGVDYWMAQEFCVWDGGRLPTEAEWEYVARASARDGLAAGRTYPWGDDAPSASCDRARWTYTTCPAGDDDARTVRVGRYPTGAAGGVFDLAGNVWEWVADNFTGYAGSGEMSACNNRSGAVDPLCLTGVERDSRVIRGGSWGDNGVASLRGASRGSYNPTLRGATIGFRCARDLPP